MNNIEWKDKAVCYAIGMQWFSYDNAGLKSEANTLLPYEGHLQVADFKLNEIRIGDYIEKSELDTEQKYNDVVDAFGLFGFHTGTCYESMLEYGGLVIDMLDSFCSSTAECKDISRKLTYNQIMAIGKLKRIINEKSAVKSAPVLGADNDQVKKPNHYQLMDGVESIEIIARSMTGEQWKGFCLGNMLKYRIRAGKKDALQQDIDKANFYGELYEMHKGKCYDN